MKKKWIKTIDVKYGCEIYVCKICGIRRRKKRDLIYHTTKHNKWEKRDFEKDMLKFNYWNYYRDKPISYFMGQIVNTEGLFK